MKSRSTRGLGMSRERAVCRECRSWRRSLATGGIAILVGASSDARIHEDATVREPLVASRLVLPVAEDVHGSATNQ